MPGIAVILAALAALAAGPVEEGKDITTSYRRSADVRQGEDKRIRAHAGMVRRLGDTLSVTYQGKTVYAAKDVGCDGTDDCYSTYFLAPVKLSSPRTGQIETYAQLERIYYESNGRFIVDMDGTLVPVSGTALGSPDGRTLASGEEYVDDMHNATVLTISSWDSKPGTVVFEPSCLPNQWNGNNELTALCQVYDNPGIVKFEGLVRKDGKGQWTLTMTRLLSYESRLPLPAVGQVFPGRPVEP